MRSVGWSHPPVPQDASQRKLKIRTGVRAALGARGARALERVERVLQGLGIAPVKHAAPALAEPAAEAWAATPLDGRKFDLGPRAEAPSRAPTIPWGYGENRVTAMAVDPERLYAYWEMTDDAIAAARADLGAAGETAWPCLRVYDVTGRLFDGTNAHAYFDHRIERTDRQWFFSIGKPGSTACVEVGLKSIEGYFVRIARSGRVDFPRSGMAPPGDVEWLTVRSTEDGTLVALAPPAGTAPAQGATPDGRTNAAALAPAPVAAGAPDGCVAAGDEPVEPVVVGTLVRRWDWREILPGGWTAVRRTAEWRGDVEHVSWEAGPFPYPVAAPSLEVLVEPPADVIERRRVGGVTHLVRGPWQVVIRGLSGRATRRVLARWSVHHWWPVTAGAAGEVRDVTTRLPGASELLGSRGGSELSWRGASQERLAGASEVYFLGASERRLRGASELLFAGASERTFPGASERLPAGASEWRLSGGGARMPAGASEERLGGGSEVVRSVRESWQAFADAGARLAADQPAERRPPSQDVVPGGASERRLAARDRDRATEPRGDEPAAPRPPRW